MTTPSFQTVRLAAGRHADPSDGVCAMELTSMLAELKYTDRPACTCAVVGAFLRGYNDGLPAILRQSLVMPWAAAAVGTVSRDRTLPARRLAGLDAGVRAIVPAWRMAIALPFSRRQDPEDRAEGLGHAAADAVGRDPSRAGDVARLLDAACRTPQPDHSWRPTAPGRTPARVMPRAPRLHLASGPVLRDAPAAARERVTGVLA